MVRIFILFLVFALIGVGARVYYYFAGHGPAGITDVLRYEDGAIAYTDAVNLRAGPSPQAGSVAILPRGTRVRIYEYNNGWARLKVLEWAGPQPEYAQDQGWVNKQYIKLD
jgi:hypothetical protein